MLDDFLVRAILAGVGLAAVTGPLGVFVVWRRMAYFGDATAHASVLGVALALALSVSVAAGALAAALAVGVLAALLARRGHAVDTSLGVLSHSALALGLVAVAMLGVRVDLEALLFGDILAVSTSDLAAIWGGAAATLALMAWRWQRLLTATVSEDIAAAEGISPERERLWLMVALAAVVAIALKLVGALLIGAMLIIPAAAARGLSRSPEQMAALAVAFGVLATIAGVALSLAADTPTGPSIVAAAAVIFLVSSAWTARRT